MAETSDEGPLISLQSKLAALALANLFLYSVAMFTLPFIAFFGVHHILTVYYPVSNFNRNVWSVVSAVVVVNIIICLYAIKAFKEKEYDEDGKEITEFQYDPIPGPSENITARSSLNLKQD